MPSIPAETEASSLRATIAGAAALILDGSATFGGLRSAVREMHDALAAAVQLDGADRSGTMTPGGLALSPVDAAECVLDYWRTVTFIRGVSAALTAARERFHDGIHVVYAGTGPFATLVLPLLLAEPLPALHFTFIDVHPASCASVRSLLERFAIPPERYRVVQADAAACELGAPAHVILVEAMNQALGREPQVAIVRNLVRQLVPEGILVPQSIDVSLGVTETPGQPLDRIRPMSVMCLDAASARELSDESTSSRTILLPPLAPGEEFSLFTEVRIFGEFSVSGNDSAITLPQPLTSLRPLAGMVVHVRYVADPLPRFEFVPLPDGAAQAGDALGSGEHSRCP